MFVLNEESRTFWFSNNQFADIRNFELIGKVRARATKEMREMSMEVAH